MFCPWALLPLSYSPSPTPAPTLAPTSSPSPAPTSAPSFSPTMPSQAPSKSPSKMPSVSPTRSPTKQPSVNPTINPTLSPTIDPTYNPTKSPSKSPTKEPTSEPSPAPTREPTTDPTKEPSREPTTIPTVSPTDPTDSPSNYPTPDPTDLPTWMPTMDPTEPSEAPTKAPIVAVDVEEARAAQFLQSPAWTALISILTMLCFCCCLILICLLCWRKYQKERDETQRQMDKMVTPETSSSRTDDRSADTNATHETDMQVVDGLETTGKMISVSELDLNVLHALNGFNRQDRKRMAATNGDKYGESKDFAIDPNLISAFMFGGGGDLNPMLMTDGIDGDGEILAGDGMDGDIDTGNPFRDGFEETQPDDYDNYNGNFINPFDDDEPNELQQADSLDEMGLLQQRMKLMKLLQQQYELMHDYNMNPIQHDDDEPQQGDHHVDVGYL
eukprot:CAMPEP_0201565380 /NCGR_PEP_ID=MMETSP0190_2-20130828/4470_1 /ASSEMBLY_ACC=CAM_ASM_000263 /TAXON_ID=37353 /ORGANISM="Rosalina sp." /LENGTH=442 /DNA_ID=CAMNT_0047982809 /DNA_START=483 /DNA_END=1811 /DNA_ORIENTATION=-